MKLRKFLILYSLFCIPSFTFFTASANALKLDLSSDIKLKAADYSNLLYKGEVNDESHFIESAALGFVVKKIQLEQTKNSSMDIGLVLQSYGSGASTNTISAPQFQNAIGRYPQYDGTPFVSQAYVKIYKFLNKDITATFGRQQFALGQGITLSDDGLGFPGALIEFNSFYKKIKADLFVFRIWDNTRMVKIFGADFNFPTDEGLWQFYNFYDYDGVPQNEAGQNIKSRTKKFAGIRYFMTKNKLSFDGELVVQGGSANKMNGGKTNYGGYGYLLKAEWRQRMGFLGKVKAHLAYGKSSGNSSAVSDTNKEFSPSFGHKYNGFERSGFGEIMGASIYDILPSSDTAGGLPEGISGLRVVNLGMAMPFRKSILSVDYTFLKGVENISGQSMSIGGELDFKLIYSAGKNMKIKAVYATFSPDWMQSAKTVKLTSISLQAQF